jgi:membrane protease YdiL (CAAX protease family)
MSDQPAGDLQSFGTPSVEPPRPQRRFSTIGTVIFGVGFFGSLIAQNVYVAVTSRTALLERPIEAVLRVQEQALDRGAAALPRAIAAYQELLVQGSTLAAQVEPGMKPVLARRLAVALAEAGRLEEATALRGKARDDGEADEFWAVLRFAYGSSSAARATLPLAGALATLQAPDGRTLGTGWATDALTARYHVRTGDERAAAEARAHQQQRAAAGRTRGGRLWLGWLPGLAGALLLIRQVARRRRLPEISTGYVKPPWTLGDGFAVFLRCGVQAMLMIFVLAVVVGIAQGIEKATTGTSSPPPWFFATLPAGGAAMLYLRRALLQPHGTTLLAAFGLRRLQNWRAAASATLIIVFVSDAAFMLKWVVESAIGAGSHWSEAAASKPVYGTTALGVAMILSGSVLTPFLEEVVFRGLLYTSLRRKCSSIAAALATAAVFVLAHGYSLGPSLALGAGAVASALVYEQTRSLWPSVLAHALHNALALGGAMYFYG